MTGPPDLSFSRHLRVRSRTDFLRVQRSGRKVRGRYLILLTTENNLPTPRFGITVSRKHGNAVERNRLKRQIREIQRLHRHSIMPGRDVVAVATRGARQASFGQLEAEYLDLAARAGLRRGSKGP
ncbi:MAG: ribonuclease P protein component [bacterium]|nr:MAG: ribonuclease P protein component [bacterium]